MQNYGLLGSFATLLAIVLHPCWGPGISEESTWRSGHYCPVLPAAPCSRSLSGKMSKPMPKGPKYPNIGQAFRVSILGIVVGYDGFG